jgi:hypothetical protein
MRTMFWTYLLLPLAGCVFYLGVGYGWFAP